MHFLLCYGVPPHPHTFPHLHGQVTRVQLSNGIKVIAYIPGERGGGEWGPVGRRGEGTGGRRVGGAVGRGGEAKGGRWGQWGEGGGEDAFMEFPPTVKNSLQ